MYIHTCNSLYKLMMLVSTDTSKTCLTVDPFLTIP